MMASANQQTLSITEVNERKPTLGPFDSLCFSNTTPSTKEEQTIAVGQT